jgi:hypothetical protein
MPAAKPKLVAVTTTPDPPMPSAEIAANIQARIAELDEYVRLAGIEKETLTQALSKLQPESAAISGG